MHITTDPKVADWLKKQKYVLQYLQDVGESADDYTPKQLADLENRFRRENGDKTKTIPIY